MSSLLYNQITGTAMPSTKEKRNKFLIRDDAKKIIKYLLNQSISFGNLNEILCIRYDDLAKELDLKNENYCRICCQYLNELHYIDVLDNDKDTRSVRLKAKGIDFLEFM